MSALIAWAWPYLIAAAASLFGLWRIWASGKSAGQNQERAKHAKDREKALDHLKRAADARPSGSVSDDPNNRDR